MFCRTPAVPQLPMTLLLLPASRHLLHVRMFILHVCGCSSGVCERGMFCWVWLGCFAGCGPRIKKTRPVLKLEGLCKRVHVHAAFMHVRHAGL